ncbi:MAG TPA: universal stress protein [Acidimicrobiia bacterium]|nr:universal stress protein [Acidimicrobiia bacterium]
MRAVVAGVDLTAMGRRVAERAGMMAEASSVPLHLVHVLEPVGEAMIEPSLARLMRDYQTKEATKLAEWARGKTGVEVDLEVVKGSPSWELTARGKSADLVVVGSSSINAFSVGPVAKRVARKTTTDTLLVRRQPRVPYRKVIAAVDFSEHSRVAVNRALALFPDADTTALYSMPSRFDTMLASAGLFSEELEASRGTRLRMAQERMEDFTAQWDGDIRTLVVDGPPTETIEEVVRRRGADLVIVASRGASATRMVLLGTVAEGLVTEAPCDVLVARTRAPFRRP